MTGAEIICELLAAGGVRYIFGNPGSTELPLMDALVRETPIDYILTLHEIPAVAMADAYAQALRTPAVVNLHASCGVGNAMGMLYNAWCAGSPVVLTAGQQDRRLLAQEPVLAGDTVAVTRPWTKWSAEVGRIEDLPRLLRRALQVAVAPPSGPVFLSVPVDLQMERLDKPDLRPPAPVNPAVRPPEAALERAVELLVAAEHPVVLAGSRVTEAGASRELAELAERLGAPIYSDTHASQSRLPVAPAHPLYAGWLPLWSPELLAILRRHDAAVVAGMDLPRLYIYREPANPVPERLRLIQLDSDPARLGKNLPVHAAVAGDLKQAIAELRFRITAAQNWEQARRAMERRERLGRKHEQARTRLREEIERAMGEEPVTPEALLGALARTLPPEAVVVDEAPTTNRNRLAMLGVPRDAAGYFAHRGWALGWGLGAAVGVKLAWPKRPVLALLGDGAALYGIQGLWTAARYRIPVVFVVANNAQYKILKECSGVMELPEAARGRFLGMDLTDPAIDFVGLARSFGVEARRCASAAELTEGLSSAFSSAAPVLLDVPLAE